MEVDNIHTMFALLLILSVFVSLYDLRTKRISNWVTLPLLIAGLIAHFPGTVELWLVCLGLWMAWAFGWMGAGDAKLWIALLWIIPMEWTGEAITGIFTSLLFTGLIQLILRRTKTQPSTGIQSPGAWRTIPFAVWLFWRHVH